jgi:bifunctional DNA-binding transcriptional regulator/antitoxin component of YhaV-PrlF toxin-antitoxin module
MTTTLSSKGQIVLNAALRRFLGLSTGAVFSIRTENRVIVLDPITPARSKGRIVKETGSGFSVIEASSDTPELTSDRVKEMLADFP